MNLKILRQEKKVTQKMVAEAIGCSVTDYSRYENEKRQPDIDTICMLAHFFETSTDDVIGFTRNYNAIKREDLST